MKKALLILGLSFGFYLSADAQVSYSCTYRQYCDWDSVLQQYSNCNGYDDNSLFVINKNETMFHHTTESLSSSYYVQGKEYDSKNELYIYDVVSDVGNKYHYMFDPTNKQVRATYTRDGKVILIIFTVKAVF
jgi:hypothetical protein